MKYTKVRMLIALLVAALAFAETALANGFVAQIPVPAKAPVTLAAEPEKAKTENPAEFITVTVKKGEILSRYAQKYLGNAMDFDKIQKANPEIKNPNKIWPGMKIRIPVIKTIKAAQAKTKAAVKSPKIWKKMIRANVTHKTKEETYSLLEQWYTNPDEILPNLTKLGLRDVRRFNVKPYRGSIERGLRLVGYKAEPAKAFAEKIANDDFVWSEVKPGEVGLQTFGRKEVILSKIRVPEGRQYRAKLFTVQVDGMIYRLKIIEECKNFFRPPDEKIELPPEPPEIPVKEEPPVPPEVPVFEPPTPEFPPPPPVFPGITKRRQVFENYFGSGYYHNEYHNKGYYMWYFMKYEPFIYKIAEKDLDLAIGFYIHYSLGGGKDRDYEYYWDQFVTGIVSTIYGKNYDADFRAGLGYLWNKGRISEDAFSLVQKQTDFILQLCSHLNWYVNPDGTYLPRIEVDADFRLPLSTNRSDKINNQKVKSEKYNNEQLRVMLTLWIVQALKGETGRVLVGTDMASGYNWGTKHSFFDIGPAIMFSLYGKDGVVDVAKLNPILFHWEFGKKGVQMEHSFWIFLNGIWELAKRSQIHEATAEELSLKPTVQPVAQEPFAQAQTVQTPPAQEPTAQEPIEQ